MLLPALIPLALKLASITPLITRWLSGENPAPLADKIISIAQTVTGSRTADEAINAILTEPDKQRAFQIAITQSENMLERDFLRDRQNARARDVALVQATGKNRRADNLAYGAILLLAIVVILLVFVDIPTGSRDLLLVIVGALTVILKDVYGFEFGTSKNAERNAQMVADYVKNGK